MRRRGNKSHRVPNVKLRPAQATPRSENRNGKGHSKPRPIPKEESFCWAQETQESSTPDPCPRPFKGVVLCTTGVTDKPTLFKQALELGATSSSAFTSRVTHLIATDYGGAKYWCAVERKIPVLKPSWITESYQIWLRGDDVDFEESVKTHQLPIFSGVGLSFSGHHKRKAEITRRLKENGGMYLENLERPVKVTHILCSGGEETDKMRYARKFNERGEADIHLVWEEWFWDSLEFGGRFNEAEYDVQQPRPEERKFIADEPSTSSMPDSSSGASQQDRAPPAPPASLDEDEEIACVAHRADFTVQLWGSLLKKRGYEINNGRVIRSPSKAPPGVDVHFPRATTPTALEPDGMDVDNAPPKTKSVLSAFRRTSSFAPIQEPSQPSRASQRLQSFRRASSTTAPEPQVQGIQETGLENRVAQGAQAGPSTIGPRGIFSGLKFRVLGEAKTPTVRSAIEQAGGIWTSDQDMDEDVDYIIVRLVSGSKLYKEEMDEEEKRKYRTECWLEKCLHEERVCRYEEHITFLPLGIQLPVAGTEIIIMSFSGLEQTDICWLSRLLRALGIELAQAFSQRTTHLLCPSGTGIKYEKAKEWGTPVVKREWLATIATTGSIPPVADYLVPPGIGGDHPAAGDSAVMDGTNVMNIRDVKGKGKATEPIQPPMLDQTDVMMNDITNDRPRPIPKNNAATSKNRTNGAQMGRKPSEHQQKQQIPPLAHRPEPPDNAEKLSFGQPNDLLHSGPSPGTQPVNPTTPRRAKPQHSFVLDSYGLRSEMDSSFDVQHFQNQTQRGQLHQEQQEDEYVQPPTIPSSKTPSPMKMPGIAHDGSMALVVLSPMRIDQALQESVTSLLGKRQGDDERGRSGKRTRPNRRPISKQSSTSSLNFDIRLASEPDGLPEQQMLDSAAGLGSEFVPETETGTTIDDSLGQEKSMWVMYEDPGQVDEKKRLMKLLKSPTRDKEVSSGVRPVPKNGTRRSTRIALAGT